MLQKAFHDGKFLVAQVHGLFAAAQLGFFEIEGEIAEGERLIYHLANAAREGAHTGEELLVDEGLGHVVVGAAVEAGDLVLGGFAGGEDEHRRGDLFAAQGFDDVEAVHLRQHDVEDDEVVLSASGIIEAAAPVVDAVHLVVLIFQKLCDRVGKRALVFNNENMHEDSSFGRFLIV